MKFLRAATIMTLTLLILFVTGLTYSEPPFTTHPLEIQSLSITKEVGPKLSQRTYLIINREEISQAFTDSEIKEVSAYALNSIGDNGIATGHADLTLMKALGMEIPHAHTTALGRANDLSAR